MERKLSSTKASSARLLFNKFECFLYVSTVLSLNENERGMGYWKFNNFLFFVKRQQLYTNSKNTISDVKQSYAANNVSHQCGLKFYVRINIIV